jgi:hypothetical protein
MARPAPFGYERLPSGVRRNSRAALCWSHRLPPGSASGRYGNIDDSRAARRQLTQLRIPDVQRRTRSSKPAVAKWSLPKRRQNTRPDLAGLDFVGRAVEI